MIIKKGNKGGALALSQIFILIISIFAFAYFVGGEFKVVSAKGGADDCTSYYRGDKTMFTYGGRNYDYTVVNSDTIKGMGCDRGWVNCKEHTYTKQNDGSWKRDDGSIVSVETEGATSYPTFMSSATKAVSCFEAKKAGTTEPTAPPTAINPTDLIPKEEGTGALCNSQGGTCVDVPRTGSEASGGYTCPKPMTAANPNNVFLDCQKELSASGGVLKLCCIPKIISEQEKKELTDKYKSYDDCIKAAKTEEEKEKCRQAFPAQEGGGFLGLGTTLGSIVEGLLWGAAVYSAMRFLILPFLGADEALTTAASMALGLGVWAGKTTYELLGGAKGAYALEKGIVVGAAVAAVIFALMYHKETREIITFTCYPWQAPTGGSHCEDCNKQGILSCSEYQCRSLGQACELINKGTDKEQCVWVNKNDVEFPTIQPLNEALLKDYKYTPDNTISPPDRGVKIEYTPSASKCVKAFTPLSFGITLNEAAKCKIDTVRKKNFEDMNFYFSGGLSLYNHSYALSLPGSAALAAENITINNDGEYELAVKCQDANGNSNTADFVFKFCVEKGPDTTPPLIVTTSIPSGNPIAYNQTSVDIQVYVNEPADCKWSHVDQSYENMENDMSCSSSIFEMNAQMLYTCTTTLTGLKNREENKFYFRCKDSSENTNKESYKFSLIGTQPLVINWAKPNEITIKDSTESIKVTLEAQTSAGYKEGKAICYYSSTGETKDYITFFSTNSHQHSQDLWLAEGDYTYFIKCLDLGGNSDIETITFTVESDAGSPIVTRAYHEETYLKLVTNEPARCVYDTKYTNYPCDYLFEDGIEMTAIDDVNHYTEWNTQITFYIKCEDGFGNQPAPDQCSIIVRPYSGY